MQRKRKVDRTFLMRLGWVFLGIALLVYTAELIHLVPGLVVGMALCLGALAALCGRLKPSCRSLSPALITTQLRRRRTGRMPR